MTDRLRGKRKPPPPPIVVTKPRRMTGARTSAESENAARELPRRAAPDKGRIKVWVADDPERQQEERFNRKSQREQLEEAIAAWCARFQRPNDPDVAKRIGRQGVGRDLTEASKECRPSRLLVEGPFPGQGESPAAKAVLERGREAGNTSPASGPPGAIAE